MKNITESNPYFNVITNKYRQNNSFPASKFLLNEVVIKEKKYFILLYEYFNLLFCDRTLNKDILSKNIFSLNAQNINLIN